MSCLGVFFSLSEDEVQELQRLPECERPDHVRETLEETYFEEHPDQMAETDKSWDAMHRALSGSDLTWNDGEYPLNHVILGGESLYGDEDFILSLKTPQQVQDVTQVLSQVTEGEFRRRYFAIDAESYGFPVSEEDFAYTWEWFKGVREFWSKAAQEGRYVLFTADQ